MSDNIDLKTTLPPAHYSVLKRAMEARGMKEAEYVRQAVIQSLVKEREFILQMDDLIKSAKGGI